MSEVRNDEQLMIGIWNLNDVTWRDQAIIGARHDSQAIAVFHANFEAGEFKARSSARFVIDGVRADMTGSARNASISRAL